MSERFYDWVDERRLRSHRRWQTIINLVVSILVALMVASGCIGLIDLVRSTP